MQSTPPSQRFRSAREPGVLRRRGRAAADIEPGALQSQEAWAPISNSC